MGKQAFLKARTKLSQQVLLELLSVVLLDEQLQISHETCQKIYDEIALLSMHS
jgi:hypothetical protein